MTSTTLAFDSPVDAARPRSAGPGSDFEAVACCGCGHAGSDPFITAEDDLTGRPGRFTFRRCRACGLVYQTPRLTLERVRDYYDDEYLAHRQRSDWGWMSPLFDWAMGSVDREKLRICGRYRALDASSAVLDVGCGGGTFLARARERHGAAGVGVDFVDLAGRPALRGVEFHCGLFYDQDVGTRRFDLVTMWHFLEHDYAPLRSLAAAGRALKDDGRLVIEVPRLDSLTFRLFGDRWPGLQAPQHTALYDRTALLRARGESRSGSRRLSSLRRLPAVLLPLLRRRVPDVEGARVEHAPRDLPVLRRAAAVAAGAVPGEALQSRHADRRLPEATMTDHAAALQSRHADRRLPEAAMTDHAAALPLARRRGRARLVALAVVSAALVTAVALALVPVACLTLFRTRRLYARVATLAARAVLRLWGVRLVVHRDGPFPIEQTVYVSNHSSTIDLFALVALGLPNTRFFLTGALRRVAPLGFIAQLMGTFFTAPQSRPAARVRIFQRADRTLRRDRRVGLPQP